MLILIGYFIIIGLIGFTLMGLDKKRSQKGQWRVPEKRFWIIGLLGGGIGLYLGMQTYHHKTKHKTFTIGMPFVILFNVICYGYSVYLIMSK